MKVNEGKEGVQFVDAESYQGYQQDKLTFRMIILQHLNKILSLSCVEFRGGYWETRSRPIGNGVYTDRIYVPDSRETYSNSIDSLHDVLFPHFDKEMSKEAEEINKEVSKFREEVFQDDGDDSEKKYLEKVQEFRSHKVSYKRRLFRALNKFLYRIKYLEGKVFEEEV